MMANALINMNNVYVKYDKKVIYIFVCRSVVNFLFFILFF